MMRKSALLAFTLAALIGCGGGDDKPATGKSEKRIVWYALMVHPYVEEVKKGVRVLCVKSARGGMFSCVKPQ